MAERAISLHTNFPDYLGSVRVDKKRINWKSVTQAISEAVLVVAAVSFPGSNAVRVISQDVFDGTVAKAERLVDLRGRFAYRVHSISTKEQRAAVDEFTDQDGIIATSTQKLRANAEVRNAPPGSPKSTVLFEEPRGAVLDVVGCIPEADSCVVKFGEKGQVGFVKQDRFKKIFSK